MRGALLVWIGLMGLAGTAGVYVLLRLFPDAFSEPGPAFAWPWRKSMARPARALGWLVVVAGLASALIVVAGLVTLLL